MEKSPKNSNYNMLGHIIYINWLREIKRNEKK